MTCPSFESLSAFADREAPAAEAAFVRAHLSGCAACSRRLRSIEAARRALSSLAVPDAPEGFLDSLLAEARPAPWWARLLGELRAGFLQPAGAVAAVGLAAAALLVWTHRGGGPAAELEVPAEVLVSAHERFLRTMPLAPVEAEPPAPALGFYAAGGEADVF